MEFINACLNGEVKLSSTYFVEHEYKPGSFRYHWQALPKKIKGHIEYKERLTPHTRRNLSKLNRHCLKLFKQGIIKSYTVRPDNVRIEFFEPYASQIRKQRELVVVPPEPIKRSSHQVARNIANDRLLHGCDLYKEQMKSWVNWHEEK